MNIQEENIMKKMCAIVAAMIAFSTVSTITIFADEVQQKLPAIEKAVKELPEMKQLEQNDAALESQYTTKSGTIKSIEKENNYYTISVALPDDEFGIVYTADANAFIVNSENGNFMTFDELQNDMKISAVISKCSYDNESASYNKCNRICSRRRKFCSNRIF